MKIIPTFYDYKIHSYFCYGFVDKLKFIESIEQEYGDKYDVEKVEWSFGRKITADDPDFEDYCSEDNEFEFYLETSTTGGDGYSPITIIEVIYEYN